MAPTPGPWRLHFDEDHVRHIKTDTTPGSLMCDMQYYPWCPDNLDDWHLIAAAPDLLAALRKAEDSLDHLWAAIGDRLLAKGPLALEYAQDMVQRVCRAREEANAAIAKAEGRSTQRESAQPCGCDPGEKYLCERHLNEARG